MLGQNFDDPKYFWGRLSATSPKPYDASNSGGSNAGPTNKAFIDTVRRRVKALRETEPGLRNVPMSELVGESHHYADFCFAYGATEVPPAAFVSTVKIKQAGFTETWDTEESFCYWLQVLIDRKILPAP